MCAMGHNCNLCKKSYQHAQLGNICVDKNNFGKDISVDNKICGEYEFGGFILLAENIQKIPELPS